MHVLVTHESCDFERHRIDERLLADLRDQGFWLLSFHFHYQSLLKQLVLELELQLMDLLKVLQLELPQQELD